MRAAVAALLVLALLPAAARAAEPGYDDAAALAGQAYRYGFPLMEFLRVRAEQTSVPAPDARGDAPVNVFSHATRFARPDNRTVVAPNVDTLYSIAHLDLAKGPIVLEHPDMGRRYFVFELLDPYTDVIGYVGSRTTGAKAGRFAIRWTKRPGRRVAGVRTIRSDYRRVWVIGRTVAQDRPADLRVANALQRRYRLVPLARLQHPPAPPRVRGDVTPRTAPAPTGLAWFDALGDALAANPPPACDAPLLARLATVGIGPGRHPSTAGLSDAVLQGLRDGWAQAARALPADARAGVLRESLAHDGWAPTPADIGDYGTDYDTRARIAVVGLGANTNVEATYPTALADGGGALLDGARRYQLVFPRGQTPPNAAFWSLTMYTLDGFLVPNAARRYAVGDTHPPLVRRADGSVVIAIQRDRPAARDVNWLPAPDGPFRLSLRIYRPTAAVLDGTWTPPPITPVA